MYRILKELDLSKLVGEITTQVKVGQFDIQFSFGGFHFVIESAVHLFKDDCNIGSWFGGKWPSQKFFEIMNVEVAGCTVPDDKTIVIALENGIEIHLKDDSNDYECMRIHIDGFEGEWII